MMWKRHAPGAYTESDERITSTVNILRGKDTYLYLDDVDVFLQKIDTTVDEKGDETTKVSYKQYSIEDLQKKTEEGDLSIRML